MGRLSIELLEAFVAVAKTGNVTHASAYLNRSQPCVSTQLRRLEERVGKPLLERSSRNMSLTQTGRTLLKQAEQLLQTYEATLMKLSAPELTGEVHVGIPEWYTTDGLQSVFCNFIQAHPNVHLKMTVADSATLHGMLAANELSLAIALVSEDENEPEEVIHEPLYWASSDQLAITQSVPLILFSEPCPFRNVAFEGLTSVGNTWYERITTTSVAAAQLAVKSGIGVCVLPAGAILDEFKVLKEEDGFPALPPTKLALYSPGSQSPTVKYLKNHLSEFLARSASQNSMLSQSDKHALRLVQPT